MSRHLADIVRSFKNYKALGDAALSQVPDEHLHTEIDPNSNSLAVIVKHVGGNLRSRFRDFLTTDGEKPDRDRDGEFEMREPATREQILGWWNDGWAIALASIEALVPEDLQKAAKVDGATAWQRFINITLPLMKPAILVALLFRTLDAFRIFDNIFVLTSGGHNTGSVSILGYDNLFTALNLGIGSAISVLIFICVAIIGFLFIRGFGAAAPGTELKR